MIAVKHRHRPPGAPPLFLRHQPGKPVCLLPAVRKGQKPDFPLHGTCRRKLLVKTDLIAADQLLCLLHNLPIAAVIFLQHDRLCLRIIIRKSQKQLRLGATECVNRLIVVPHQKQVVLRLRQKPQNLILHRIHILRLIHQKIRKPAPVTLQHFRSCRQYPLCLGEHIVKVDFLQILLHLLILPEHTGKFFPRQCDRLVLLQRGSGVFDEADRSGQLANQFSAPAAVNSCPPASCLQNVLFRLGIQDTLKR